MDFNGYLRNGKVKRKSVDIEEGKSLFMQAQDRLDLFVMVVLLKNLQNLSLRMHMR